MTKEKIEALEFILERELSDWEIQFLGKLLQVSQELKTTKGVVQFGRRRSYLNLGLLLMASEMYDSCIKEQKLNN